jgi:hypothetical protein
MVAAGIDDDTVMAVSGHSSKRMLERYTHPTDARKIDALGTMLRAWSQPGHNRSTSRPTISPTCANC